MVHEIECLRSLSRLVEHSWPCTTLGLIEAWACFGARSKPAIKAGAGLTTMMTTTMEKTSTIPGPGTDILTATRTPTTAVSMMGEDAPGVVPP